MFEFFRPRPPQTSAAPSWPWVFGFPARSEPAWDAFGHTVLCAMARVVELDAEPRKNGGKAGKAQVDARVEAKALARKLLREWMDRRLDGREVGEGSIAHGHVDTPVCERNRNTLATMRKS